MTRNPKLNFCRSVVYLNGERIRFDNRPYLPAVYRSEGAISSFGVADKSKNQLSSATRSCMNSSCNREFLFYWFARDRSRHTCSCAGDFYPCYGRVHCCAVF